MEQHHEHDGNGSQALHVGAKAAISRWSSSLVLGDGRGIDGDRHPLLSQSAGEHEGFPHSPTRASDHRSTIVSAQKSPSSRRFSRRNAADGETKGVSNELAVSASPIICLSRRIRLQRSDINSPTCRLGCSGARLRRSRSDEPIGNAATTLFRSPSHVPLRSAFRPSCSR